MDEMRRLLRSYQTGCGIKTRRFQAQADMTDVHAASARYKRNQMPRRMSDHPLTPVYIASTDHPLSLALRSDHTVQQNDDEATLRRHGKAPRNYIMMRRAPRQHQTAKYAKTALPRGVKRRAIPPACTKNFRLWHFSNNICRCWQNNPSNK